MTLREAADVIGVSAQFMSDVERGVRTMTVEKALLLWRRMTIDTPAALLLRLAQDRGRHELPYAGDARDVLAAKLRARWDELSEEDVRRIDAAISRVTGEP